MVVLPDGGRSYISKLYDDEWMRKNGLMGSGAGRERVRAVLAGRHHGPELPPVVLARTTERVEQVIETLQRWGISQLPVTERDDDAIEGIVGSVDEKQLLERVFRDPTTVGRTVGEVMERPLPTIDLGRVARRCVRGAVQAVPRRSSRSGTGVRPAWSPSSTCWSTWRTWGVPAPMTPGSRAAGMTAWCSIDR